MNLKANNSFKCHICNDDSIHKCDICGNYYCEDHIIFGRLYGFKLSKKSGYFCYACWRIERNTLQKKSIDKISIMNALKKIGVNKGDSLLVQSSLSSIGYVEGGPDSLIDAILYLIGTSGNILMPSFTKYAKKYNPKSTIIDKQCGIIPTFLRKRFNIVRTENPKISFIAKGKKCIYLINNAISYDQLDEMSPLGRLLKINGKILLIGTELNNCLAVKYCETICDNKLKPSCGEEYYKLDEKLKDMLTYKEVFIGESLCRIFVFSELKTLILGILAKNPNYFSCKNINCKICSRRTKIYEILK